MTRYVIWVVDVGKREDENAYLSTWLAGDEIAKGELRIISVMTPEYGAPVTALWPVSRNLSPRIRVVVDKLHAALNKKIAGTRL